MKTFLNHMCRHLLACKPNCHRFFDSSAWTRELFLFFATCLTFAMCGCATTTTYGLPPTFAEPPKAVSAVTANEGFDRHLVVLRIPVGVAQDNLIGFQDVYNVRVTKDCSFDGKTKKVTDTPRDCPNNFLKDDRASYITSAYLAKTSFFGMTYYNALKLALPGVDVVIQPTVYVISEHHWRRSGRDEIEYSPRPMQPLEQVAPATIVVDFSAYVGPRDKDCTSFGYHLCPLVSIRTHPTASPATDGALAGPETLTWFLAKGESVSNDAAAGSGATLFDAMYDFSVSGFFGQLVKGPKPLSKEVISDRRPLVVNRYLEFPVVSVSTPSGPNGAPVPGRQALDPFVFSVVDAVHAVSPQLGVGEGVAYYASLYDTALADRVKAKTTTDADRLRLGLVSKFRDAEVKFLISQDVELAKVLTTGEFAASITAQQNAEVAAARRQDQADSAGMLSSLAVISATLSSTSAVMAARSHDSATLNQANSQTRTSLTQAQAFSAEQASLQAMNAGFAKAYAAVGQEQVTLVMAIAGSEETVRARSISELREKFKEIYKRAASKT